MTGVRFHHESEIPARLRERVQGWDAALRRAMRRIAGLTERAANRRLSGPGGARNPGAYPVPRRTGFLARSLYSKAGARTAEVGNTAAYAASVHNGFRAFGNPAAPYYGPRPYLDDAVAGVDPLEEIARELSAVLP